VLTEEETELVRREMIEERGRMARESADDISEYGLAGAC
jgi:hypothetical protein